LFIVLLEFVVLLVRRCFCCGFDLLSVLGFRGLLLCWFGGVDLCNSVAIIFIFLVCCCFVLCLFVCWIGVACCRLLVCMATFVLVLWVFCGFRCLAYLAFVDACFLTCCR